MSGRFCIRQECVDEVLNLFASLGIAVTDRRKPSEGVVSIEVASISDKQGQALAAEFKHEWSAVVGIVGGHPFETKH